MENIEIEASLVKGSHNGDCKSFVPYRFCGAGVARFGGETPIRVNPEDDVWLEIAVSPVDVFEVLRGDDGELEIDGL